MKTVIIVSKCLRVTKINSHEMSYEFHFKGACAGQLLRKVVLSGSKDFNLRKNEEYLICAEMLEFFEGVLRGRILKVKCLEDCWDRS